MAEHCVHVCLDPAYCAKCGRSVAEISGDQRSSRTLAPGGSVVRALRSGEREDMGAFLAFCRAEPMPTTPGGWLQREAEARERWPAIADLFDGWGVDAAATARAAARTPEAH